MLMVESEANGLTEEEMLNAVKFGHEGFVPVIEMIEELAKECRKPEWTVEKKIYLKLRKNLKKLLQKILKKLLQQETNKIDQIKFQKLLIKLKNFMRKMKITLILMLISQLKNLEKSIVEQIFLKTKIELMVEVYQM